MGIFTDSMSVGSSNLTTSPPTNGIRVQGDVIVQSNMYVQGSINSNVWSINRLTTPVIYAPTGLTGPSSIQFASPLNLSKSGGIVYGPTGPVIKYSSGTCSIRLRSLAFPLMTDASPEQTLSASYTRHGGNVTLHLPTVQRYELNWERIFYLYPPNGLKKINRDINPLPFNQLFYVQIGDASYNMGVASWNGGNDPIVIAASATAGYGAPGYSFKTLTTIGWPNTDLSYIIDADTPYPEDFI
jgi:hypothetical protein